MDALNLEWSHGSETTVGSYFEVLRPWLQRPHRVRQTGNDPGGRWRSMVRSRRCDIITIASVNAVNRVTKQTTGQLRQSRGDFDVASGATSIPIYPAIVALSVPAPAVSDRGRPDQ